MHFLNDFKCESKNKHKHIVHIVVMVVLVSLVITNIAVILTAQPLQTLVFYLVKASGIMLVIGILLSVSAWFLSDALGSVKTVINKQKEASDLAIKDMATKSWLKTIDTDPVRLALITKLITDDELLLTVQKALAKKKTPTKKPRTKNPRKKSESNKTNSTTEKL